MLIMRDLEMNKTPSRAQEVHSAGSGMAHRWARGLREEVTGGGDSRGPFAHPRCAHGPLLDLAQALLADEPAALGRHAVHIQVVQ